MKILVTGTGITGKSTFRRKLVKQLRTMGLVVEHFDADCFQELRHPADIDCLKERPEVFSDSVAYVIEDIHGPIPKKATLPIEDYDFIFYLKPSFFHHLFFWLDRLPKWFRAGVFSWEQGKGWKGTGKPRDWRNVWPIAKIVFRDAISWRKWIAEDLAILCSLKFKIVESSWAKDGPQFR
ncbi:MAG: hypothetical protein ABII74_05670, partial [Elusimicrobiota bacterium]